MQESKFYVGQEVECTINRRGVIYEINESDFFKVKVDFGGGRIASYALDGRIWTTQEPTLTPVIGKEKEVSLISTTITNALLEAYRALKNYDEKVSVVIRNTKHRPTIAMLNGALTEGRTVAEMIEAIKPNGDYSIIEENCNGCFGLCGNCHKKERDSTAKKLSIIDVLYEVEAERIKQDNKWGEQNHDPFAWLAILGEEVGEANKHALQAYFSTSYTKEDCKKYEREQLDEYRNELIQIAAVAVAMIECYDRNNKDKK